MKQSNLKLALLEGEGLGVEFKEKLSNLDREIVAFANTAGGVIYIGITDEQKIVGVDLTNKFKSQVMDIARNCDPSIKIELEDYPEERVLAVHVTEGQDKPYRCKDGFFMRIGPSSQKLRRDEIVELVNRNQSSYFDEEINEKFRYPQDFAQQNLDDYLKSAGIKTNVASKDLLISLGVAKDENKKIFFTNAGVLFFAKDPQRFFPESYITCVKYKTHDRFAILDKKDIAGSPLTQIEQAMQFIKRHMSVEYYIPSDQFSTLGKRQDIYDFSPLALREAIINAVMHRDYRFDSTHIYIHMFPDHIDIESPGGLIRGLSMDDLGRRSLRRNRLVADLLHRAGFIERVGSGFARMQEALEENNNPPLDISVTNFFNIRFHKRIPDIELQDLTARQIQLYRMLQERGMVTKNECALTLNVSGDTILRDLKVLIQKGLVEQVGGGKTVSYRYISS